MPKQTTCGISPANMRVSPSHSAVTTLAQGGKRRTAGRAGCARRSADNMSALTGSLSAVPQ